MRNYRFLHRSTIPASRGDPRRIRHARLIFLLSVLLSVLGSLALAYTFTPGQPPPLTHALAQRASPQLARHSLTPPHLSPKSTVPLDGPLFQGNPRLPEIALTFDDGPQPSSTPQILAILQRFGVPATFFCIGQQVLAYPALVRQESADGELVEDHTWSHPNLLYLSAPALSRQLSMTANAIYQLTHTFPAFFRPPYGTINASIRAQAKKLNLSIVMWNVDPRDWSLPGSQAIIARVLNSTHNGSIILLHDGGGNRAQTIAALPTIITALHARGLRFVTIQQLVDDLPQPA
jgi:peptidoglycan/xylan/chitin deacetylase (PgdA/CDA1 family)